MAHRGGLLDADADAAARGVFDRLFGLVGEAAVVPETVNEEQSGYGERASLSTGADTQANARASPAGWAKKSHLCGVRGSSAPHDGRIWHDALRAECQRRLGWWCS